MKGVIKGHARSLDYIAHLVAHILHGIVLVSGSGGVIQWSEIRVRGVGFARSGQ